MTMGKSLDHIYIYGDTCNGPTASYRALFLRNICQTKKKVTFANSQSPTNFPSQPLLEHANGGPWQQEIPFSPEGGPNDMAGNIL